MAKLFFCVLSVLFLMFVFSSSADASVLTIKADGRLEWKVLSAQTENELSIPESSSLVLTKLASSEPTNGQDVSLIRNGDQISLVVDSEQGKHELNVTGWKDTLVEVEETPMVTKLAIGIDGDGFSLSQSGIAAKTIFPISVDPGSKKISVETPSGKRFLSILPKDAYLGLVRAKILNRLSGSQGLELTEAGGGDLYYKIHGERVLNLFNIYELPVEVSADVSASTGEVLYIDQPKWLGVLGYFLS